MKQAMTALMVLIVLIAVIALRGIPAHARIHAGTHARKSMLGGSRIHARNS